MIDTTNHMLS